MLCPLAMLRRLAATTLLAVAVTAATGDAATTTPHTTKMSPLAEQLHGYGRPGFTFQKSVSSVRLAAPMQISVGISVYIVRCRLRLLGIQSSA